MIYNIPTDYCYDRHGARWDWSEITYCWEKRGKGTLWEEYSAINKLAEERGPLTDTPPITIGTVLDTAEKCDACPPFTLAHWPGTLNTAVKTPDGSWARNGNLNTSTSEVLASELDPYTVIYIPEGDE